MLIYLPLLILNFLVSILCYITNPIVVLFANEVGELPGFLSLWQTHDDSLDPRFFVVDKVASIFKYDYDRHYEEYEGTTPELEAVGRTRYYVKLKDPNFTLKEKIQRYFCRVLWLTRNNAYGFSFWWFGRQVDSKDMVFTINKDKEYFGYDKSKNILITPWVYKNDSPINSKISWQVFLGWKIGRDDEGVKRYMIANRPTISIND